MRVIFVRIHLRNNGSRMERVRKPIKQLISHCLTFSGKYYMHIQDKKMYNNIQQYTIKTTGITKFDIICKVRKP